MVPLKEKAVSDALSITLGERGDQDLYIQFAVANMLEHIFSELLLGETKC